MKARVYGQRFVGREGVAFLGFIIAVSEFHNFNGRRRRDDARCMTASSVLGKEAMIYGNLVYLPESARERGTERRVEGGLRSMMRVGW